MIEHKRIYGLTGLLVFMIMQCYAHDKKSVTFPTEFPHLLYLGCVKQVREFKRLQEQQDVVAKKLQQTPTDTVLQQELHTIKSCITEVIQNVELFFVQP